MNGGHSWAVLGVIVELLFHQGCYFFLPILLRLYLTEAKATTHRRVYRTRPALGREMLHLPSNHVKNRRLHLVADSTYGGQSVLCHLLDDCDLTSHLLIAARLYDAPPQRPPGTNGRPRKRGQRFPTPEVMRAGRCRRRCDKHS